MWLALWAQEPPTGQSPLDWVEFGVLGLVVLGLLTGLLWARPAVDRILRENDELKNEILPEVKATRAAVEQLQRELRRDRPAG